MPFIFCECLFNLRTMIGLFELDQNQGKYSKITESFRLKPRRINLDGSP